MQEIQLKEYLHQIWKRRKIVALFTAVVVVIVTLSTLQQPKIFRAKSTVEIGSETPDAPVFRELAGPPSSSAWSSMRFFETQKQIIQSRSLLQKVAERALKEGVISGGSVELWTSRLQRSLFVETSESSTLITIHFDDTDPGRAQRLSILIAEGYVDQNLGRKLSGVEDAAKWLDERLREVREEKARKWSEVQKYREDYKLVPSDDKENISRVNLLALTESLNRLKGQRIEYEAQYNKLNELVKKSARVEDLLGVVTNDLLTKFKHDLADLRFRRAELAHRYKEKHPESVRLNAEIAEVEKSIRQEVANEVSRLRTKFLLTKAEEDSIESALEKQKLEALRIEEVKKKLYDLEAVADMNERIYQTLQKKLKETDLSAMLRSNNIRIVDKAIKPSRPIRPTVMSNILLGLVIGFLGGVGLALFIEYLDDTLKTHEDIERYLKLPVLAIIPHHPTASGNGTEIKLEFLPLEDPSSTVAEFYRTLRTNILFLSRTREKNRLMVVSTGPGEGKTVTAVNLAVTLAQIGQKTIVVDLDFRRPKLHDCFETTKGHGVTNVLVGEVPLDQVIARSRMPNLDYVLAGSIPPNPAELMASGELQAMLDELSRRYERVIVDSSPIAPVTDAVIAAQMMHGVVLVVRAGRTHRKAVFFAHEQLGAVHAHVLGVVLNDIDIQKSTYGSYEYYRYGYSSYAPKNKPAVTSAEDSAPQDPEQEIAVN